MQKKANRAKMLFDMMNGNSSGSSSTSSVGTMNSSDKITDGDKQVMEYMLFTSYKFIEDVSEWGNMEDSVAFLTKNQIYKLLEKGGDG